ncbi:MAG: competence/damage-inducible protein A [Bacteroidetes bacterium]|nr:competence/damage-inducible protein A [Bacteroidota bacterium]
MNAEILTIGDELLLGQVVDTNSAWIGLRLAEHGIMVSRRTAVGDVASEIIRAVSEARNRTSLLILTGGLGPTRDDITKNTLAQYFRSGFRTDENVMRHLEQIFEKRGRKLLEINKMQASVPENCTTLFNELGTAPGMLFRVEGLTLISLPGVPAEMKHILENEVFPKLSQWFPLPVIIHKTLLTSGIPESMLADILTDFENNLPEFVKLAYLPAYNSIRLRLTAEGNADVISENRIQELFDQLAELCGEFLVTKEDTTMPVFTGNLLIQKKLKIALAESCTGGYITNQLVRVPGISEVMLGGLVTYANEIKMRELGVPANIFQTVGAVSEACALAMVEGVKRKFDSDIAISTTGIAGPGGATDEKPVGLVYVGISTPERTFVKKFNFPGSRDLFMERVCNAALDLLRKEL